MSLGNNNKGLRIMAVAITFAIVALLAADFIFMPRFYEGSCHNRLVIEKATICVTTACDCSVRCTDEPRCDSLLDVPVGTPCCGKEGCNQQALAYENSPATLYMCEYLEEPCHLMRADYSVIDIEDDVFRGIIKREKVCYDSDIGFNDCMNSFRRRHVNNTTSLCSFTMDRHGYLMHVRTHTPAFSLGFRWSKAHTAVVIYSCLGLLVYYLYATNRNRSRSMYLKAEYELNKSVS